MERSAWLMMTQWQNCRGPHFHLRSFPISNIMQLMVPLVSKTLENHLWPRIIKWCMVVKLLNISCLRQLKQKIEILQHRPWKISPILGSITSLTALTTRLTRLTQSSSRLLSKANILEHKVHIIAQDSNHLPEVVLLQAVWSLSHQETNQCGLVKSNFIKSLKRFFHPIFQKFRFATPMLKDGAKSHPSIAIYLMVSPIWRESSDKRTTKSIRDLWLWRVDLLLMIMLLLNQLIMKWRGPLTRWL